jgi:hypothetical protein
VTKRSGSVTLGPLLLDNNYNYHRLVVVVWGLVGGVGGQPPNMTERLFKTTKKEEDKKFPVWLGGRFAQGVYPWSTLVNENGRRGFTSPTQI